MNEQKKTGTVQLFANGGLGFNIGAQLQAFCDNSVAGAAHLKIGYIDTSDSNMTDTIDASNCYFLPKTDGSGKNQGEHLDLIDQHAKQILQKFPPSNDLNIVLSSAGGGSGAVISSTLASIMIEEGHNVIAIVVGSTGDLKEIRNTKNVITTYQNVSDELGKPISMAYFQNSEATPQAKVDRAIVSLVGALCVLFSRQNHGMDRQDLKHWLQFSEKKITNYGPRLALLSMFEGNQPLGDIGAVISVATLTNAQSGSGISQTPEYQCVGVIPDYADKVVIGAAPVHFVNSTGKFASIKDSLDEMKKNIDRQREALVEEESVNLAAVKGKANRRGIVVDD